MTFASTEDTSTHLWSIVSICGIWHIAGYHFTENGLVYVPETRCGLPLVDEESFPVNVHPGEIGNLCEHCKELIMLDELAKV